MLAMHSQGAMLPGVQSLAGIGRLPGDVREMPAPEYAPADVVAWFGSYPIRESDKCSSMLAGATFVQAEIVDYNGKKEAMFVFSVRGGVLLTLRATVLTPSIRTSLSRSRARSSSATAR